MVFRMDGAASYLYPDPIFWVWVSPPGLSLLGGCGGTVTGGVGTVKTVFTHSVNRRRAAEVRQVHLGRSEVSRFGFVKSEEPNERVDQR